MAKKTVLNPAGNDPHERPAFRRLAREIAEALAPDDGVTGEADDDRSQHDPADD
jgi:hypothetical protein